MSLLSSFLLVCGGIVTGTIGALLGIGGGLFLIPFLVLVFNVPMHQAIATSLIAVIATSSAGATMNLERRTVNVRLGMLLEITTVLGAIAGGLTAAYLSGRVLARLFSAMMFSVALLMMYRLRPSLSHERPSLNGVLKATFLDDATGKEVAYSVLRVPVLLVISLAAGNLSGLLGVGGGFFKVPAMTMAGNIPMKAATATSNFMIGVTAAASTFIYFAQGHVNPFVAAPAVLGVLAGSYAGISIGRRIASRTLTWVFAVFLAGISIQLYFK